MDSQTLLSLFPRSCPYSYHSTVRVIKKNELFLKGEVEGPTAGAVVAGAALDLRVLDSSATLGAERT